LYTGEVPLEAANQVPWETAQDGDGADSGKGNEDEGETKTPPTEKLTEAKRRERLVRLALGQVLVRLTGTRQVTADPLITTRLLERAGDFVERFQYLSSSEQAPARLRARFSQPAVWEALQETGWPVWGSPRPTLLVWVAVRGGSGWRLGSPDGYPELFDKLERTAAERGLPLVVPLLDGTDRQNLAASDLLFQDWQRIQAASERYDADAVLTLRVWPRQDGDPGEIHWAVRYGEQTAAFSTVQRQTPSGWVDGGIHRLVAFWSHRFAVFPGEESRLEVVVEQVDSLADFAAVQGAMEALSSVAAVRPVALRGNAARFRLRFQGRPADLEHTLSLNNDLSALGGTARSGQRVLHFAYRP
jgi:hypothetical protein